MNFYFLFFSLYGLMILPVNLHFRLRLGKKTGYWFRVEAAGLPFSTKRASKKLEEEENSRSDKTHALSELNFQLLRTLMDKKTFHQLLTLGQLTRLNLYLHLSFHDAAQTALLFGVSRVFLDTITKMGKLPPCLHFRIRGDFLHSGSILLLDGILSARLGKLLATFLLLGWSYRRKITLQAAQEQPTA